MFRPILVGALSAVLSSGCASVPPAQFGQTAGTIAGAAIAPGVGAPVGAALGLLAGILVQQGVDRVTETRERRELSDQLSAGLPSVPTPVPAPAAQGEPVRVWVDETERGGRIVAGHFEARAVP